MSNYIVGFTILACLIWFLVVTFRPSVRFIRDEFNPFRKYCTLCGQQYDAYEVAAILGTTIVWQQHGYDINAECKCHKVYE